MTGKFINMFQWLHENLSTLLDFPVPDDLTEYILSIENERDLDEYLRTLLDYDNPKHKQFVSDLKKRKASKELVGYKKSNSNEEAISKPVEKKKGKIKLRDSSMDVVKPEKVEKKKTKFVNLYAEDGRDRSILLKGRNKCDCEAKQHSLINNCLNCGRIVCNQEGAGPCFFCGELVCSPEQQQILAGNSRHADTLYNQLMDKKPKGYEESVKQRNRLLEFDRNSSQRTKVIDDENDYYQSNSVWLSKAEKERLKKREDEIQAQKHKSRLDRKVNLDFAGREIVDADNVIDEAEIDQFIQSSNEFPICDTHRTMEFQRPTYVELNLWPSEGKKIVQNAKTRIQDKEYLEMSDEGYCLSMHQPYASLLVAGIKIHEGRTWYSSHRGRLWIAAASKVPSVEEISSLEQQYRILRNENISFPESYPTGCLLGCVTVQDVLSQEEYRTIYPDGESDCPYVFVCEDFHQLPIKFPMQGKHKIYKLDTKIHRAAMKLLERVMKMKLNVEE